jgi:hypothetical protein
MSRFIDCGELNSTGGYGLKLPLILSNDGIYKGDLSIDKEYVKNGKLNFQVEIKEVGGDFSCDYNNLSSLEGAPEKVGGDFYCSHNNLSSLEGCPKYVGGDFNIRNNTKEFTEEDVRAVCNVKGKVYV